MRNAAWYDTETVFMTLAEEPPEAFRVQWWMGMRLIDAGDQIQGLEWLKQAVDINPNELRLQLDFVRDILLAGRSEEVLAIVSGLPPADPDRDVYLTQSHIQLGRPDLALEAAQGGLSRFPEDARLMSQARELRVSPETNPPKGTDESRGGHRYGSSVAKKSLTYAPTPSSRDMNSVW
jgi:hypothetical protein